MRPLPSLPSPVSSLALARRRARLRRRSAGAAIFIVAITLGLLAAMGVYGMTATANDVRAAGHMRQALQAQRATEFSLMATAESFTPGTSAELVRRMKDPTLRSTNCKSAKPPSAQIQYRDAEACLMLREEEMKNISNSVNQFNNAPYPDCATPALCPFFNAATTAGGTDSSFGAVPFRPFLRVEITNPVDIRPPPGMGLTGEFVFTQLTASVYVEMKTSKTVPAESVMLGRGRVTVGPYRP